MVIVAGHITVEPAQRESYLAGCVSVVVDRTTTESTRKDPRP
jgi:hypothetical protein